MIELSFLNDIASGNSVSAAKADAAFEIQSQQLRRFPGKWPNWAREGDERVAYWGPSLDVALSFRTKPSVYPRCDTRYVELTLWIPQIIGDL